MPLPARLLCFFLFFLFLFIFPSKALAAFSFSIDSVNPTSVSSKTQEVSVSLTINDLPSESYFRVGWKEGNSYFGYVKNNSNSWVKIQSLSSDCTNYYHVTQTGNSQITLVTKIGEDTDVNSGSYEIKAHRFTMGCSSTTSTNTKTITVNLSDPSPLPNPSPSPSPVAEDIGNILINEVMACPSEDKEWVELFNNNDNGVNLNDWLIRDSTDSNSKKFSTYIGSKSYARVEIDNSFLNNDGDTVRLMNGDSQKDSMSYDSCEKGYSWSKVGGSWCQTNASPQQSNSSCLSFDNDNSDNNSDNSNSSSPSPTTQTTTTTTTKNPSSTYKKESASSEEMLANEQEIEIGEILGATESGEEEEEEKEEEEEEKEKPFLAPLFISGAGLLMLGGASFPFIKPKVVKFIERWKKRKRNSPKNP